MRAILNRVNRKSKIVNSASLLLSAPCGISPHTGYQPCSLHQAVQRVKRHPDRTLHSQKSTGKSASGSGNLPTRCLSRTCRSILCCNLAHHRRFASVQHRRAAGPQGRAPVFALYTSAKAQVVSVAWRSFSTQDRTRHADYGHPQPMRLPPRRLAVDPQPNRRSPGNSWLWVTSLFLTMLGAKLWLIGRFWHAAAVLGPLAGRPGRFISLIFTANCPSWTCFRRIMRRGLFLPGFHGLVVLFLNGQWDAQLEMVLNAAILHCP